jgi:adenylylsulfate kinase-like enzyme
VIPVLWLCGPPGVGKSTLAWRLSTRLRAAGIGAAYADVDQISMCFPEQAADPGRHLLKAHNVASLVANFAAHGATCVVISGIVDPARRPTVPGVALTLCRLRADRDELVRRFVGRSGEEEAVPSVLTDADDMEASAVTDLCVDTTGLTVSEALARVSAATTDWYTATGVPPPAPAFTPADGQILWVGGVPGVGMSMVGYDIYQRTLRSGHTMGYLDLRQVGFGARDRVDHQLRAANAAAAWRAYRDLGADGLVITGEIDVDSADTHYRQALPAATLTVCRLHADRPDLAARILPRGEQTSWTQPGDPLLGRSTEHLRQVVERSTAHSEALDRADIGVRVDSSGLGIAETADAVLATGVWPLLTRWAGRPAAPRP